MADAIKVGDKMRRWIGKIILRDLGKMSYAKGLYHIISLYLRYVPKWEKDKVKKTKKRRLRWT